MALLLITVGGCESLDPYMELFKRQKVTMDIKLELGNQHALYIGYIWLFDI